MGFITGRLFKTLSYRVDKEINDSLYQNEVFLRSQWSLLEKSIVLWSSYYIRYIILAIVFFLLLATNIVLWRPWLKPLAIEYLPHWDQLLQWQANFLGGQLTIVGVVYPLVVGLISILFQNKSAKKTIFPIYQKYSGFMFAGLSGLSLSGFIILGYFLRAYFDDSAYVAFCVTSAFWLVFNLLLTAWFFVQTFRMLDEVSSDRLVRRFSIHESCEYDIREKIKQVLIDNAVENKLLSNPDNKVLKILTLQYADHDFKKISRIAPHDVIIKDIRYRLINFAIRLQIIILKLAKITDATIIIHSPKSQRNSRNMVIAQYDGFEINPFVKLLIKSAFSFNILDSQTGLGLSQILNGFSGSANDALRENNVKEFSDAIDNIANWHTEIALALSFKNDEGKNNNWLFLTSNGLFGISYLGELMHEYYQLSSDSVEKVAENSRFYKKMLYLHKRIFSYRDKLEKKEIMSLIQGSYNMWPLLLEWRSYSSNSGDLRIANKYEDVIYDFVGAWESWLIYIEPPTKRSRDIDKTYFSFITHLEFTASTAISALRFKNSEAAGWGVDMLNNWFETLSPYDHWNEEYSWHSVLLTHDLFLKKPTSSAWKNILKGNEYNQLVAFNLAFKNASFDLRILTACYMLLNPDQDQQKLLVNYVQALLSGEPIHKTGGISCSQHSVSSAGDLLGAYIRHRNYYEGTYDGWITSILDSFGRIHEERQVPGRIYSGWGANNPKSMDIAYVEIAIYLSKTKWGLSSAWKEAILSHAFRYRDKELMFSDLRDWIKIAQEERSYILFSEENKADLISNFCESITEIIHSIETTQTENIQKAGIDQNRLRKLGIASSMIINSDIRKFPLSLFESIEYQSEMDDMFSCVINITNYEKERVALGVETNRAINEEDILADSIKENVRVNILKKLIQNPSSGSYQYQSTDSALLDIGELAKSFACPVLFVGNPAIKNILNRSSFDRDIANNYNISRRDGFGHSYICHIGSCEVYGLYFSNIEFCLLTSKELFDKVSFREISEDQFVEANFIQDEDNENIGKLKLKYWMKIELLDTSCIKLELDVDEKVDI